MTDRDTSTASRPATRAAWLLSGGAAAVRADVRRRWVHVGLVLLILLLGVLAVGPVIALFARTFTESDGAIERVLTDPVFYSALWNTVYLSVGSLIISLVLGVVLAWIVHRLPAKRRWMAPIPLIPIVVPQVAMVVGWVFLLSPRVGYGNAAIREVFQLGIEEGPFDVYTTTAIVFFTGLSLSSYVFIFVRSALSAIPQDVLDAAATSGAGSIATFFRVVIPLMMPAIIYGGATSLLLGLGQFTVPLLLGSQARIRFLSTQMYEYIQQYPIDYGMAAVYSLPILVAGLVFLLFQRLMLRNQGKYVVTGKGGGRPLRSNGIWSQLFLVVFVVVAVVLPFLALLGVALSDRWTATIDFGALTLRHFADIFDDPTIRSAIVNTLFFSVVAMLVALVIGYICARVIVRRAPFGGLRTSVDYFAALPLGIPSVIFGAGFLYAYTSFPLNLFGLYGTPLAMILVYITLSIPFTTRIMLGALVGLGDDLNSAAAVSGAGWLRRTISIDIPMLRQAIASAGAMTMILLSHEFSASLFVRSSGTQVLGTVLYNAWSFGSYPQVAAIALIMCVVTAIGLVLAAVLTRDWSNGTRRGRTNV